MSWVIIGIVGVFIAWITAGSGGARGWLQIGITIAILASVALYMWAMNH